MQRPERAAVKDVEKTIRSLGFRRNVDSEYEIIYWRHDRFALKLQMERYSFSVSMALITPDGDQFGIGEIRDYFEPDREKRELAEVMRYYAEHQLGTQPISKQYGDIREYNRINLERNLNFLSRYSAAVFCDPVTYAPGVKKMSAEAMARWEQMMHAAYKARNLAESIVEVAKGDASWRPYIGALEDINDILREDNQGRPERPLNETRCRTERILKRATATALLDEGSTEHEILDKLRELLALTKDW